MNIKVFLLLFFSLTQSSLATTFDLGDTMVRLPKKPQKEARVRLGVKIIPYQKVIVKDPYGVNQIRFMKAKAILRNIRTQISKSSHFYISQWHLETVPVFWNKTTRQLSYEIKLYKRYGSRRELEEFIGSIKLSGLLEGSKFVYNFMGKNEVRFKNKNGYAIADLTLSPPLGLNKAVDVARSKP